jgi:1-phosphofructokinase family hexose kinase
MILCVTLNPCLDKTLTVPPWRPGESVRGTAVREVVGGKGNNVARALARLGRKARPVTFFGGAVGDRCAALLREADGLDPLATATAAATREILTVRTGDTAEQTAFFDPDPAVGPAEAEDLFHRVQGALAEGNVTALTLSGSSPSPATHGLYADLIALARSRRVPVFLDSYGPALDAIWGFWPAAIQLNRGEAAGHLGTASPTEADLLGLLDRWSRHGVAWGVITDGPNPALVRLHGRCYRVSPPRITAVNPVGSGDCLLAGLVDGWLSGLGPVDLIRRAFGAAAANALVWDAGALDPAEAVRQGGAVTVEPLDP